MNRIRLGHALVVGAGVAGLSTALRLPSATVLASGSGSTALAQGGIAAALGEGDHWRLHAEDTVAVAGEIAARAAVEIVCDRSADAIGWLTSMGATFDRHSDGSLRLGLEAGHRRRRIVAAAGDAIGSEVNRTLREAVATSSTVNVLEGCAAIDLLWDGRKVTGVVAATADGTRHEILSRGVVLATGGLGRLFLRTTNPVDVDGSGIAMAGRAGARLIDLEFVQFHPTALDLGVDPMPLATEALRGEGAVLVDDSGERFMVHAHPAGELAPRDVVARAVWHRIQAGRRVFLDARSVPDVVNEFPTVTRHAGGAGLDPAVDPLPISPAAHYLMGGIDVDDAGRSSLPNLWVVGEAASTGVHGANRLASNSLLEGLVFATRVATDVGLNALAVNDGGTAPESAYDAVFDDRTGIDQVRALLWNEVGVVREQSGLESARDQLREMEPTLRKTVPGRIAVDLASWMIRAALVRAESRGAHFRADHPRSDVRLARRNSFVPASREGRR
ncbi:MAG: L-aspartate oxidase [Acidimicrobiia bacterium]